jgi:antitoxin (DNA-binding transcriptional repressor) of toxin-antitoxin stability system
VRRTITQRELRNESAAVMDAVEQGETITIMRSGVPTAEPRPVKPAERACAPTNNEFFGDDDRIRDERLWVALGSRPSRHVHAQISNT